MFATSLGGRKEEDGGGGKQGCQEKVTVYLHPRTCSICKKTLLSNGFSPNKIGLKIEKNVLFPFLTAWQPCVKEEAG